MGKYDRKGQHTSEEVAEHAFQCPMCRVDGPALLALRERNKGNMPFHVDTNVNHIVKWVKEEGFATMKMLE